MLKRRSVVGALHRWLVACTVHNAANLAHDHFNGSAREEDSAADVLRSNTFICLIETIMSILVAAEKDKQLHHQRQQ